MVGSDPGLKRVSGYQENAVSFKIAIKFLIPNALVGSIIGRSGSAINDMQKKTGARMQLSKGTEYFPSTTDRILLVFGTVNQILTALHLLLAKLEQKEANILSVRMLVHSRLCGSLIGKGGVTIRSFTEDSKATLSISAPSPSPGLTERIVKITGQSDHIMRAVALLVTKLSENPDIHLLSDMNLTYPPPVFASPPHVQQSLHGSQSPRIQADNGSASITIGIPESRVGSVIGRGGDVISQIKDLLGVAVHISERGEYMAGTTDRECQITGEKETVELAQRLIKQRIGG